MPRKRAKKANAVDADIPRVSDSTPPKDDLLMLLPVEILSQILIHTRSTRDVLAVARCSKYLCVILVDPLNATIWSSTRRNSGQGLYRGMPDPPSGMTEPAYAAFVFDGGKCQVSVCILYLPAGYINLLPCRSSVENIRKRNIVRSPSSYAYATRCLLNPNYFYWRHS